MIVQSCNLAADMTQLNFIQSAHWETPDRLLIQLQRDWNSDSALPPLFLGPEPRSFHSLKRVPLVEFGRIAHYYATPTEVVFVLDPEHAPQLDFDEHAVYVAGAFNGWEDARQNDKWKLQPVSKEGRDLLQLRVARTEFQDQDGRETSPNFKFILENGTWLPVSLSAPNLVYDGMGNANLELRFRQSGNHLFRATLASREERSGEETLIWKDEDTFESYAIPSVLRLLDMEVSEALGVFVESGKTRFRIFVPRATRVEVRTYRNENSEQSSLFLKHRGEGLWEGVVEEDLDQYLYHYQVYGRNRDGTTHFDPSFPVLDPYARAALGPRGPGIILREDSLPWPRASELFTPPDWHDLVILECHLEDLVAKSSYKADPEERPGYGHLEAMLRDKHSYLRALGVNAIELQPLQQSDKRRPEEYHWGYMTTNFFCLESSYAEDPRRASQIEEFRGVVQAAHDAGIAVILDVVYNHVGEPAHLLFLDKYYYFELDDLLDLENWSGVGNDLRCSAPMVKRLIIDSLLYLVRLFDIDGFRFDLAELIGKPVLNEIQEALKQEKPSLILIAEPWSFRGHLGEQLKDTVYASWNDRYRDFIRDYVRGSGNRDGLQYFLSGSRDTLANWPAQTVNYTESHDDRCWLDEITENADYNGFNPQEIDRRRTHLMVSLLLMSFGMPMLAEGQDFLRSKHGVKNTYQRGDLNALDYQRLLYYTNTHRYFRNWIKLRQGPWGRLLRRSEFPGEGYLRFFSEGDNSALMILYNADQSLGSAQMFYAINPHLEEVQIPADPLLEDGWIQVSDSERIRRGGLTSALVSRKRNPVNLPSLSTFLWMRGDPDSIS